MIEPANLIERLSAHRIASAIPAIEKEWLAANGRFRRLEPGDVLTSRAAGAVEGMFVIFDGHITLFVERGGGRELLMEWHGGDVSGMLPYSRMGLPPGDAIAEAPTELLVIPRERMPECIRQCHCLTSALIHVMVDRARHFKTADLHAEKMASLGKLSAGLAHELNNPVSAVVRGARSMREALTATEDASRALGAMALTAAQEAAIEQVRSQALRPGAVAVRSPLEQADREAEFEDWLLSHGAGLHDAAALAETGITLEMLDGLAGVLNGRALNAAVAWLAAGCATRQLAEEIAVAGSRISTLVDAVKGFTRMDRNAAPAPVDVAEGLSQTLAIHSGKARGKAVAVRLNIAPGLPRTHGVAGELNQVWANLLDNALDAVPNGGTVTIGAACEGLHLVVRFLDDGPGIAADIRDRIFDPFFTTKGVGQGTGLGLDIVKRILQKHEGTIAVDSEPGRTEFRVTLQPLAIHAPEGTA